MEEDSKQFRRLDRFIRGRGWRTFFILLKDEETGRAWVASVGDQDWIRRQFEKPSREGDSVDEGGAEETDPE